MKFWTKSLMARLVSYFLLLSLVIVSLVGYIAFVQAREALKQSVLDRLNAVATLKEELLNHWVDMQRQDILLTAQLPEVQAQAKALLSHKESEPEYQAAYAHLLEYLTLIAANRPDLQEIFILTDVGGKIILSTNKSHEAEYHVKAGYFTQGRLGTFVQNVYPSPVTIKPTMTIATPLLDETGRRLGVLAAHLNLERMDQIVLERTGLGESGETYLVDKFNVFVSGERFGRQESLRGVHTEGIDTAMQGIDGAGLYLNYAGVPVIGVYRWLDDRELALLAEMHQDKAFAPARRLALTICLVGLVSAGALVVGVYLLARQIARPILAITDTATQVAAGDLTPTAPVLTEDEVGVLARTFNQMTEQLQALYANLEEKVAQHRKAEDALRVSEQNYRTVVEGSLQGITIYQDNRIVFINRAMIEIMGYTLDELLALSPEEVLDLVHPEDRKIAIERVQDYLTGKGDAPVQNQYRVVRKDGTLRWLETFTSIIEYGGKAAFLLSAIDITERRQLEKQLRQSQKIEAIGRLAGGVAHDFNNILTVIIGNSELILSDSNLNNRLRKDVEQIKKVGNRAAALTHQLLAFSRQQILQPQVLNLNGAVANTEKMLRRLIGEDIDLVTTLEPKLGQVKADPGQIEQVIINLAINARDAMPQGGRLIIKTANTYLDEISARQRVGVETGPYVMLAVSDTGNGIDAETQSRIFEPFFTTKEQGKGTGLGLATVNGIIDQSGGHIRIHSQPGQGATFKVYLPQIKGMVDSVQLAQVSTETLQGSETILLVEDEDEVRDLAHRVLLKQGYTVLDARQGAEALQICQRHPGPIHLLITDVVMPEGMSGRELAERLASLRPKTKALYMSGYTDNVIVHYGVLDSDIAFLQKPFTPNTLIDKVHEMLGRVAPKK